MDNRARRCMRCQLASVVCICDRLPLPLPHATAVTIVQHPRERAHGLGTARILRLGLQRARLVPAETTWGRAPRAPALALSSGAVLLDPGGQQSLDANPRPSELVVIDGTWAQAGQILRDSPALAALPRRRLQRVGAPRYRLRRELVANGMSTVEAVVHALQRLEPEHAQAFEVLLDVLEVLLARREAQMKHAGRARRPGPIRRRSRLDAPDRVLLVWPEVLGGRLVRVTAAWSEAAPVADWIIDDTLTDAEWRTLGLEPRAAEPAWRDAWLALAADVPLVLWRERMARPLPLSPNARVLGIRTLWCRCRLGRTFIGRAMTPENLLAQLAIALPPARVAGRAGARLTALAALYASWVESGWEDAP